MLPTPTSCKKGERRREVEREFKEGKGGKGKVGDRREDGRGRTKREGKGNEVYKFE